MYGVAGTNHVKQMSTHQESLKLPRETKKFKVSKSGKNWFKPFIAIAEKLWKFTPLIKVFVKLSTWRRGNSGTEYIDQKNEHRRISTSSKLRGKNPYVSNKNVRKRFSPYLYRDVGNLARCENSEVWKYEKPRGMT